LRQHLFDQRQIHLGLAATGDAIEQKRLVLTETGTDRSDGLLLFVIQLRCERSGQCLVERRSFAAFEQAGAGQSTGRLTPAGQGFGQLLRAHRAASQKRQQCLAAAATAAGIVGALTGGVQQPVFVAQGRQWLRFAQGQWQGIRIHLARRAQPVVGSPGQRLHQLGVKQRGVIEKADNLFQPAAAHRGLGIDRNHHADQLVAAERHQHPTARARLTRRGRQVVEQGQKGHRQGNAKDGWHGYLMAAQCNRDIVAAWSQGRLSLLAMSCAHLLLDYREVEGKWLSSGSFSAYPQDLWISLWM